MERLTEREGIFVKSKFKGEYASQNILARLAEYEDTGLTPTMVLDTIRARDIAQKQALENAHIVDDYRQAEEQGLILRLPCPIGSTIWKFEYPTKVDENGDEWTILDKKRATVAPLKFALCHLDSIGTLYFVTREEAEQASAEMQKG